MRRILLLLFLLAVSASATANVTLGELEVRSFLNQPLQAQFRAQGGVLAGDDVEFRVASEDAYRRAGLQRAAIPADLNIEIQGTGTSRTVRLSTMRPVREPYLGLLLEVRWPAGRMLREFTILLDPPVAFAPERSAAPVISPAPEPVARVAPAPVPAPAPVARTERPAPGLSSYTVRRGDTLSAIVNRQAYSGVTMQQAMLAILDANPQAFTGGNINQLRAGAELRLPDETEVAAYGRQESLLEVRRQTAEWRERTAPAPPPAVVAPAPAPEPIPAEAPPALATEPPSEPLPEAAAEPPAEPDTGVAADAAEDDTAAVAGAESAASDTEVAVMDRLEILGEDAFEPTMIASAGTQVIEEALLSQQVAMRELREELSSLRTEVSERDQLIQVMNTELAELEQRMQALREQRQQGVLGGGTDAAALYERVLADPLLLLLAATSVLLFLLLLVSMLRTRRIAAEGVPAPAAYRPPRADPARVARVPEQERTVQRTGGSHPDSAAAAAVGAGAAAGVAAAASTARDEREPVSFASPPQNIDVSEDPKAEDVLADVDLYLAYGMNDQAITALENAIRDGQKDPEYRVRLVEAYAASDDADAVYREAEALRDQLGPEQQALRERVDAAVASVPAPDARDGEAKGSDDPTAGLESDDGNALEFDLGGEAGIRDVSGDGEPDQDPLRFDLDDTEADSPAGRRAGGDDPETDELPELTLPDLEPLEPEGTPGTGTGADSDTSENGMKLSLAEAFVEMGDREGAAALLEEILPTATEEQKAKVEAIRRQLEGGDG